MKKEKRLFIILTIALVVIVFFCAYMTDEHPGSSFGVVMAVAMLAYLVFDVYFLVKYIKTEKEKKSTKLERYNATLTGTLKHISGLPLAKNVLVDMYYGPEKITFRKGGEEIKVAREKVTSIDLVSAGNNARNAMAGAASGKYVLGGTTGAVVGSLASMKYNLVISYVSDGKNKSITLDIASSGMFAQKVIKDFGQTAKVRHNSVEL